MLSSTESEETTQDQCELEVETGPESANSGDGHNVDGSKPIRSLRIRSNRRPHIQDRVRHKRQTLQDMAKPLKAWLYEHKDNPYPTKTEKILLALGSHMTIVQVSNWFANARRRLKNTVRHPGLTWSKRIKMYNHFVKGNAELLSISSGSSDSSRSDMNTDDFDDDISHREDTMRKNNDHGSSNNIPPSPSLSSDSEHSEYHDDDTTENADDAMAPPKYKHTILQRYLNDSFNHHCQSPNQSAKERVVPRKKKSGSLSSHDYEDMSTSPNDTSSNEGEHQHRVFDDFQGEFTFPNVNVHWNSKQTDETYWKEINAAMALTHMARLKQRQLQARDTPCGATR
ncbi:homeobox protein Mohawk-like [Ptychodera flava]|uniref:homeobox protein Mohawk-like n=1 Tax=Ptychodera flava TaxID=63121 RepID=UPI00396A8641